MASYRLSDKALVDLDRLYAYGVLSFGQQQADAYFDALVARFQDIADRPETYPTVGHIRKGYRRSVFRSHAIYYYVTNDEIAIVRILGQQDIHKAL